MEGLSEAGLLPWLAGLVVMLLVLTAGLARVELDPVGRRARRLAAGSGAGGAGASPLVRLKWAREAGRRLLARLAFDEGPEKRALQARLAQAGIRRPDAPMVMQLATLATPTVGALLGWALAPAAGVGPGSLGPLALAAAGAVAGAHAPRLWLANRIAKRRARLLAELPLALDLYVICVESGLGPDAAMARVAAELGPAAPAIADELGLTSVELGFLPDRGEAFRNLAARAPLEEIRALVAMFQQTERYGTPLAQALRTLAESVREAAMLRVEEKAARLPAMLTVPLILFVLPPLFIVLIGPAILQLLGS